MAEQKSIRFGILGVVAALLAGLVWLGIVRYQAEQRSLHLSAAAPLPQPAAAGEAPAAPVAEAPAGPVVPEQIVVHVAGAVAHPAVYKLEKGARVADAIAAAGGALPDAVPDALNLADRLEDGQKVTVPTKKDLESAPPVKVSLSQTTTAAAAPAKPGKVNINTATVAQLDALPNVTPTMAKNIVEYRSKHGPFKKLEELDNVVGIGPATIEKLRPNVTL